MIIRRMTLSDVDDVYSIEKASFKTPWSRDSFTEEMTRNPCARYLLAVDDQAGVIGYAGVWIVLDEGHITNIAVREDFRGRGVGEKLCRALNQYAANLGVVCMTLEVRVGNAPARHLYEKLGFFKVGLRPKYYADTQEDALLLALDRLPPADPDFAEEETREE